MRDEFQEWVSTYPRDRAAGLKTKRGTRSYQAIMTAVPAALMALMAHIEYRQRFVPTGSTGSGNWTELLCVVQRLKATRPDPPINPMPARGLWVGLGAGCSNK
jgi:hypothetical protein